MYNSKTYYGGTFLEKEDFEEESINRKIELEYYGIANKRNAYLEEESSLYGIEVVKKEYKEGEINIEANCIENISKNGDKIIEIINTLKRHKVTPVCLDEVLEDLLRRKQ